MHPGEAWAVVRTTRQAAIQAVGRHFGKRLAEDMLLLPFGIQRI